VRKRNDGNNDDFVLPKVKIDKRFPSVHALREVNFDFRRGEVHAQVGENGAQKSTLIKILSGASSPGSDDIYWHGMPVRIE
jgi:ABC-type sugar transport system ATPase subunit